MENKIKSIIATVLNIDVSFINDETSTQTLENWDSLNHMNIILATEEEFGITFDDEVILKLTSFRKLLEEVKKLKEV